MLQAVATPTALSAMSFPPRRESASWPRPAPPCWSETPHLSLVGLSRLLKRDVSSLSHSLARTHDRLSYDRALRMSLRLARRRLNALLKAKAAHRIDVSRER